MEIVLNVYFIARIVKTFIINLCIYYSCSRIMKKQVKSWTNLIFVVANVLLSFLQTILNVYINMFLVLFIVLIMLAILISKLMSKNIGYSMITVLISYAICNVTLFIGTIIGFTPYKIIFKENLLLGTLISGALQFIFTVLFFKIKRFKNGFEYLYKKLNTEFVDIIVIYLSICVVLLGCFMGSVFSKQDDIMKNSFITLIILSITMYIMIQRTLTMQYKHSLLLKTLEEYKEKIVTKDKELEKLSAEKFNTSKIRHEFYNRQKALELMVKQNMNGDVNKDDASESILNIINELTSEYSKECEIIKGLVELPKTDVLEIDNLFKYMQTECAKNNIDFKLNIQDSIHPLLNNYISKSRLETLLGDHIRDAINALNKSSIVNKEILVVLGLKDGNYEICIYDNGVEFTIDTLLKLGKEQVTTGGTGIGFITTFETLRETNASLVITEFEKDTYTKSVAICFDNKREYVINSYRHKKIKKENNREDIIINKIEG